MFARSAAEADVEHGATLGRARRRLSYVDAFLVALALPYVALAPEMAAARPSALAVIVAYALALVMLRNPTLAMTHPHPTHFAGAIATVLFIAALLALSGPASGFLSSLFLLPVIAATLTLGRGAALGVLGLVFSIRLALGYLAGEQATFTGGQALLLLAEALPVALVVTVIGAMLDDAQETTEQLRSISDRDDLTGLLNLQAFTRLVEEEMRTAQRRGSTFALTLVDVEGLKFANERYGHEAGNRALEAVARALQRSCRSVDLVARYGGDEFVMFLAGADAAAGRAVANRIRHNVATTTLEFGGKLHRMTVAVGAAVFPADGRQLRDLLNRAAEAMKRDRDSRRPLPKAAGAVTR